jgi:hypothetical protein
LAPWCGGAQFLLLILQLRDLYVLLSLSSHPVIPTPCFLIFPSTAIIANAYSTGLEMRFLFLSGSLAKLSHIFWTLAACCICAAAGIAGREDFASLNFLNIDDVVHCPCYGEHLLIGYRVARWAAGYRVRRVALRGLVCLAYFFLIFIVNIYSRLLMNCADFRRGMRASALHALAAGPL